MESIFILLVLLGGGGVATEDPRPSGRGIRGRVDVAFAALEGLEGFVDDKPGSDIGEDFVFDAKLPASEGFLRNCFVFEKEV